MEGNLNASEEQFKVTCSDEEVAADFKENYSGWEPKPDTIQWLYETIARDKTIPLKWSWEFGKRSPTPTDEETGSESDDENESEKVNMAGFDFDDEASAPKLTPRRAPGSAGPKGSAKKRTTNFENILANVRRHRKLEAREKSRSKKDKK